MADSVPGNDSSTATAAGMTAAVMATFLRTGKPLDHASSVFLLGTVFLYGLQAGSTLAIALTFFALLIALVEKYYAWRVALDAELFAILSLYPDQSAAFDQALAGCLDRPAIAPPRSLHDRWRGAKRLLCWQAALCVIQALAMASLLALKAAQP
jgi:hypothetical protein